MRCELMILASLLSVLAIAAGARADEVLPPGYSEAVKAGLAELDAGNYPEAREEFRRAHEIMPNARTLRGLGMVAFELRNYADSVRLLEQALASQVRPLTGKVRAETEELLGRSRRYVGDVRVKLKPNSAQLIVDGAAVRLAADQILRLEVGSHTLEARAAGRITERRVIEVSGGDRSELELALAEVNLNEKNGAAGGNGPSEVQPAYKKWWVWTTIGVVLAGGAVATGVLLLSRDKERPPVAQTSTNSVGVQLSALRSF